MCRLCEYRGQEIRNCRENIKVKLSCAVRMPSSIRDGSGKAGQVVPEFQLKGFFYAGPRFRPHGPRPVTRERCVKR